MTDKHTPGPWTVQERITEPDNHGKYSIYDAEYEYIGTCDAYLNGHHDTDKNLANARLIAAAPELLEALESIAEHGHEEEREVARDAIKAAKGND